MNLEQLLFQCKFSRRYKGYQPLYECVKIALEDENRLLQITGIYSEVADKFQISASGVERNIRTLLNYSWENGGKKQFEQIAGGEFYNKPSVGEAIEILTCYLKNHGDL